MGGLVAFAAAFSGEFPIKGIISFEVNPPWILDKSKYIPLGLTPSIWLKTLK